VFYLFSEDFIIDRFHKKTPPEGGVQERLTRFYVVTKDAHARDDHHDDHREEYVPNYHDHGWGDSKI
jgi:hypothetical protein